MSSPPGNFSFASHIASMQNVNTSTVKAISQPTTFGSEIVINIADTNPNSKAFIPSFMLGEKSKKSKSILAAKAKAKAAVLSGWVWLIRSRFVLPSNGPKLISNRANIE